MFHVPRSESTLKNAHHPILLFYQEQEFSHVLVRTSRFLFVCVFLFFCVAQSDLFSCLVRKSPRLQYVCFLDCFIVGTFSHLFFVFCPTFSFTYFNLSFLLIKPKIAFDTEPS